LRLVLPVFPVAFYRLSDIDIIRVVQDIALARAHAAVETALWEKIGFAHHDRSRGGQLYLVRLGPGHGRGGGDTARILR
jgi:hypothetical protein